MNQIAQHIKDIYVIDYYDTSGKFIGYYSNALVVSDIESAVTFNSREDAKEFFNKNISIILQLLYKYERGSIVKISRLSDN